MTEEPGRRERKKAMTRQSLADAALALFLERGFDHVTVTDIAELADVSVTTLFKHFPGGKQALVFDEEAEQEAALVAAVRERAAGQSVLSALRAHLTAMASHRRAGSVQLRRFTKLVTETPALRDYGDRMCARRADALAEALIAESADPLTARALARCAIDAVELATGSPEPVQAVGKVFDLLEHGWGDFGAEAP